MAEIIVQGHKIDTKDIWDVEYEADSRGVWLTVRLTDKEDIVIGRRIPYESYPSEIREYHEPYDKLHKELKEKWEADKTGIPVFKI